MQILENIPLCEKTTARVGGNARYWLTCVSPGEIVDAVMFARKKNLPLFVLGGGSNVIFPDRGYPGVICHIAVPGIVPEDLPGGIGLTVGAGVELDDLVRWSVDRSLAGFALLSGIPGTVGAAPVQNAGAYGSEIATHLTSLTLLDLKSGDDLIETTMDQDQCGFSYRTSRFKQIDRNRYIIVKVQFFLPNHPSFSVDYKDILRELGIEENCSTLPVSRDSLMSVRQAVLTVRRRKSMVVDPGDPDSHSTGSFFTNPVFSEEELNWLQKRWRTHGLEKGMPLIALGSGKWKIPAAYLIEKSGFPKGYSSSGARISRNHALALVSESGQCGELMALAKVIEHGVKEVFGIQLEREPIYVEAI